MFKKIRISTFEGFKPFLCLEIRSPAFENIGSEGTEVAGIQNIFFTTLTWGIITPSPRRCLHHLSGSTSSRRGQIIVFFNKQNVAHCRILTNSSFRLFCFAVSVCSCLKIFVCCESIWLDLSAVEHFDWTFSAALLILCREYVPRMWTPF